MAAEDKIAIGIGVLVPQIFYDMIARLVPGSVMLAVFALTYVGPNHFFGTTWQWLTNPQKHFPSVFMLLLGGIVFSYSLSIILWGFSFTNLWNLIFKLLDREMDIETGIAAENLIYQYELVKKMIL